MSYPELTRRAGFLAAKEPTPGTPVTLAPASHGVRLIEPPDTPEQVYLAENATADVLTGSLGVVSFAAPSGRGRRLSGRLPLFGAATAYTDAVSPAVLPESDPILQALYGAAPTVTEEALANDGTAQAKYDLADDPAVTITAGLEISGKQYKLAGGVLERARLVCDAGGFPILEFAAIGFDVDPVELSLEAISYDEVGYPIFKGAGSVVVGGFTGAKIIARRVEIDWGVTVQPRASANDADAHAGYKLTRRAPTIRVVAEVPALAAWNPWEDWDARVSRPLDIVFNVGAAETAYARIKVNADDCRVMNVADNDDNGLRVYTVDYQVNVPATGDELALIFD